MCDFWCIFISMGKKPKPFALLEICVQSEWNWYFKVKTKNTYTAALKNRLMMFSRRLEHKSSLWNSDFKFVSVRSSTFPGLGVDKANDSSQLYNYRLLSWLCLGHFWCNKSQPLAASSHFNYRLRVIEIHHPSWKLVVDLPTPCCQLTQDNCLNH